MKEFVKIVLWCMVAAVAYGIVHDQITARICIEYFTVFHPPVVDSDSPTVQGLVWGILATWWVGALLGIGLASCARLGKLPQLTMRDVLPGVTKVLIASAILATLAGWIGHRAATTGELRLQGKLAERIPAEKHVAFTTDLCIHMASYAGGFVGATIICALSIQRRRKRAEEKEPDL